MTTPDSSRKSEASTHQATPPTPPVCPECGGSGWRMVMVEHRGRQVEQATRCECIRRQQGGRLLEAARIPRRYRHCELSNFEHEGPFRSLAHAAGVSPTMADPRRVMEVDLVGTALLLDAFEPMVGPGSAAVCFSSSSAYQIALQGIDPESQALVSDPRVPGFLDAVADRFTDSGIAYAWAKRGVIAVAARAAVAWGRRGGRVNSLAPGLIDTPMGRREFEQQPIMQVMLDATPLERLGRSEEAAAVVAFLASARTEKKDEPLVWAIRNAAGFCGSIVTCAASIAEIGPGKLMVVTR